MVYIVIAACLLPADPHWVVGSWQTGTWGGVEFRPDGYVIEKDPDGNVTDVGRWSSLGDSAVVWTMVRTVTQEECLALRDGAVYHSRNYGSSISKESEVRRGHCPREFESYVIEFEPEEMQPVFGDEDCG